MTEKGNGTPNLLHGEGDTDKILHPKDSKKREDIENMGKELDSISITQKLFHRGKKLGDNG